MSDKPLFLLDGYSLVYRSYFAFIRRPLRNPRGENSSAIFGFFRSLFQFFSTYRPDHFAVVLDSKGPTFRHEQYEAYKGTRDETPEELTAQIPIIERILEALGVPMIRAEGYEADDVIATLCRRCTNAGRPASILSGDKDLLQLVGEQITVLKPENSGFNELHRDDVHDVWGVWPEQIVDFLALVGDKVDNVPGVRGIGEKTAAKLLAEYRTLDGIYEHLEEISSKSQKQKLEEGREDAFSSRDLVTLSFEAPVADGLDQFDVPASLDYSAAIPFFEDQGMHSLVRELGAKRTDNGASQTPKQSQSRQETAAATGISDTNEQTGSAQAKASASQSPAGGDDRESSRLAARLGELEGTYECVRDLESLDRWIDKARNAGRFAFDSETDALDAMTAKPVGFSLAVEPGEACYIPLTGPDGPVLSAESVRERLTRLFADEACTVIGQNLQYDYKVLVRWGVPIEGTLFDTLIAAWLIDTSASSYGMDKLAMVYLGYDTLHYDDIVPKAARGQERATFESIDLDTATRYAAEDADVTLRLADVFALRLAEDGLETLAYETEMPLVRIVADMERQGIAIDREALAAYSKELVDELSSIERHIFELCGHEFNIASTQQLQKVLFEERGLTPVKKTKTGYSTDTAVLEELSSEDPVPERVLRHRTLSKLKSTYVDALPRLVNEQTGRIHTSFVLTGTATGRLSSRNPNLQNIPIREEEGRRIRSAFVPAPGNIFVSADYAQIELVVLGHLSGDPGLREAFAEGRDVHSATGSMIFGVAPEEVTAEQRRIAKTINFGVMYGMSAFRLSRELKIPRSDADHFIQRYFATYSRIKTFVDECVEKAKRSGYTETLLGRRRALPELRSRNRAERQGAERIAVNTPIQGTAADIVKRAMIAVDRRLRASGLSARLILQVHDELMVECPLAEEQSVRSILEAEMPTAVTLDLPLKVSIESGASWGDFH
ncbi:MAG: DNA polymerase I [Spirochaetales bacterium]